MKKLHRYYPTSWKPRELTQITLQKWGGLAVGSSKCLIAKCVENTHCEKDKAINIYNLHEMGSKIQYK